MAKYHGKIGFVCPQKVRPGVIENKAIERVYNGDVIRIQKKWDQNSDQVNDDLTLGNQISIVADEYAYNNFASIRYATYMGVSWRITNVTVARPRLVLTLGGVYNGPNDKSSKPSK